MFTARRTTTKVEEKKRNSNNPLLIQKTSQDDGGFMPRRSSIVLIESAMIQAISISTVESTIRSTYAAPRRDVIIYKSASTTNNSSTSTVTTPLSPTAALLAKRMKQHFLSEYDSVDPDFSDKAYHHYRYLYFVYATSCFMYSLVGLLFLFKSDILTKHWSNFWPWKEEGILLFIQGVLSYMSDVQTIGIPSIWHSTNRTFATILFVINFVRTIMIIEGLFYPIDSNLRSIFYLGFVLSSISYVASTSFSRAHKVKETMLAHTSWHFFLLIGVICIIYSL